LLIWGPLRSRKFSIRTSQGATSNIWPIKRDSPLPPEPRLFWRPSNTRKFGRRRPPVSAANRAPWKYPKPSPTLYTIYEAPRPELFLQSDPEKVVPQRVMSASQRRQVERSGTRLALAAIRTDGRRLYDRQRLDAPRIEGENASTCRKAKVYKGLGACPYIEIGLHREEARHVASAFNSCAPASKVFQAELASGQINETFHRNGAYLFSSRIVAGRSPSPSLACSAHTFYTGGYDKSCSRSAALALLRTRFPSCRGVVARGRGDWGDRFLRANLSYDRLATWVR